MRGSGQSAPPPERTRPKRCKRKYSESQPLSQMMLKAVEVMHIRSEKIGLPKLDLETISSIAIPSFEGS